MAQKKERNPDEELIKEKFMQFQMMQKQIEQVSEQLQSASQQMGELELSKDAIKELAKTDLDKEILAPVANGIFIKTKLGDNQKLIINVGSDVTVEKSVEEVLKLLDKQEKNMAENMAEGNEFLERLQRQAMKLYKEVEEYVED